MASVFGAWYDSRSTVTCLCSPITAQRKTCSFISCFNLNSAMFLNMKCHSTVYANTIFSPSFKWCFVNCTSYACSVIWHNDIQTQSWMSVKKGSYTSEDLVIWKKMTSIPKHLRFMLVRTRAGFLCPILIAHLWWIQNSVIWGTSGIHKFLSSLHATTTTTTLTKDTIILSFQFTPQPWILQPMPNWQKQV